MMRRVGLCLAFRDMWQSSCGYFPSASQLRDMASAIAAMGCFDRVETNGGAFEQVCLMQGYNPNLAVREFAAPLRRAGIKTQMLERGLNALRLNPVPADVRELMFKVKAAQGVEVVRSFCGLNDPRNIRLSIEYAKAAGMISQVALPVADSPVHTIGHYMQVVFYAAGYGCDEICIKDMAGQGEPLFVAELIRSIKTSYPEMFVQYHSHCGNPSSRDSLLEAVRAGADCVDVALGPLAGGVSHPEVLDVVRWLREGGYEVNDIDMEAYGRLVSLIDDCLSAFTDMHELSGKTTLSSSIATSVCASLFEENPEEVDDTSAILRNAGLPGGMMSYLSDELPSYFKAMNLALCTLSAASGLTFRQFLARFADEVRYVWPALGYPPMVTPFSQYVANAALSNLLSLANGQPRWSGLSLDVWNMILGRMGKLPGELDPALIALAEEKGFGFYDGEPQSLYQDSLGSCSAKMLAEGWSSGPDDEELLEFAMHENQYRDYMSVLSACLGISDSKSVVVDEAVYAAIAMALHEYLSTEISSWD